MNMRSYYLLLFIFTAGLMVSFTTEPEEVQWISLSDAQNKLKSEPRAIFIDFTADWCGWCKVMDKNTFSDETVAKYMNENFYAVRLDYDSKTKFDFFGKQYTARELGEKYRVPGLPTILLVSSDNKKSKKVIGYKKPEPFLEKIQGFQ